MTRGNEPVGVHRVEVKKKRLNPWWIVWNAMVGTMSLAALALVGWSAGVQVRCRDLGFGETRKAYLWPTTYTDDALWCFDHEFARVLSGFIAIVTCLALSASILMVAMHAYYNSGKKYLED